MTNEEMEKWLVRDTDALGYLKQVYNDPDQPIHTRMRAAAIAIEYERPTLKAMAVLHTGDMAQRLEAAIKRSEACKLIELQPSLPDQQD